MRKLPILTFALFLFAACAPDMPTYVNFDILQNFVEVENLPAGAFHPTSGSIVDFNQPLPPTPSMPGVDEQHADTTGKTLYASSLPAASIVQSMLGFTQSQRSFQVAGTYSSIDQNGDSLILSGKVVLPESGKVRNIVLVSHYTIGANFEAPSQCFPFEGLLAGHGYAVLVPDYIGFGATSYLPHPYMSGELTATNVIDFYFAVLPYLELIGLTPKDSSIYLMGYSQGGATTMMVQYLLETQYYDKVKIRRNFAGAGPYDLAATYDKWMADDITGIPCAVPMIIQGMNIADNLGLDYSIFFKPNLLESYEEIINSKKYTVKQQGALIGVNRLSDIVTDECRDKRTEESFKLYRALMRNSVAYLWSPLAPVYMFHSQDDDTVPFKNSQIAREQWAYSNIQYNFGHYGNHMKGYLTFLTIVNNLLKQPS